jgi:low temperature requirement protein LtrA
MRSRWYHAPDLHTGGHHHKKVSWLELFFDLIFVAAFIQLGDALSSYVSLGGFVSFAASFLALWVVWTTFSYFLNRYSLDDFLYRFMVFLLMFSVGGMGIGATKVLDKQVIPFAAPTAVALLIVSLMYLRSYKEEPKSKDYSKYWGGVIFISSMLWAGSCFFSSDVAHIIWAVATLVVLIAPLSGVSRRISERFPTDYEHLSERFGLLTLIVLGESFVKVLSVLSKGQFNVYTIVQTCVVLMITCSIWWIYFDDVAGSKIRKDNIKPFVWLYGHFPLQMGITATGVAIKKALYFDLAAPIPDKYRWLICGVLARVLLSVSLVDSVTERRNAKLSDSIRVNFRTIAAIAMLLLAPVGGTMPGWLLLTFIVIIMMSQVIFDMIIAPTENIEDDHGLKTMDNLVDSDPDYHKKVKRFDPTATIIKGVPSKFRKDIYYFLIEGSWKTLGVSVLFLFMLSNLIFASLYLLDPGSMSGVRDNSFFDAFSFSVQTMSTIGFGAMTPGNDYGHLIMISEAAFSLVFVAFCTGVTFAKASKPKASFLFTDDILIHKFNGENVLTFRAANAKGSEVVDANVSVHVLKDHKTKEGHSLRRFQELKLQKSRSPVFSLTWVVYHVIDETSPLYDVLKSNDPYKFFNLIITLNGYDAVYGQTVHEKKIYYPENVRFDRYFEDIIHFTDEGQIVMDYDKFNQLKAT